LLIGQRPTDVEAGILYTGNQRVVTNSEMTV
jgi:hypothetical protein